MLTPFNRRELAITWDMSRQSEIRALLAQNGIAYSVRVTNRTGSSPFFAGSRARTGSLGVDLQAAYQYTIYVHKSEYARASAIIDGRIGG